VGRPTASVARRLILPVSNDTLLRVVRRRATRPDESPTVIGIDDWAYKRGQRYGAIVCDLERRRVVTLLPDRESGTVEAWLACIRTSPSSLNVRCRLTPAVLSRVETLAKRVAREADKAAELVATMPAGGHTFLSTLPKLVQKRSDIFSPACGNASRGNFAPIGRVAFVTVLVSRKTSRAGRCRSSRIRSSVCVSRRFRERWEDRLNPVASQSVAR